MDNENIPKIVLMLPEYFWIIAIAVTCLNAFMIGYFMKKATAHDRIKVALGAAFWLNVPWIVMGFGSTIGGVPSIWHYFKPRDGNPFVLAWWAAILAVYVISSYWIFIGNGAAKLAWIGQMYDDSVKSAIRSELGVKIVFLLMLTGGIIAGVAMWFEVIPLPSLSK